MAMVALEPVSEDDDAALRRLIEDHHRWTGSRRARELLDQWPSARSRFVKVFPHEYRRALADMAKKSASGHEKVAA
jgi:glutamate synthase domain-containing protein 3